MAESTSEQRRRHFRLVYPITDRPWAVIEGVKYPIINISESGALVSLIGIERALRVERSRGVLLAEQTFVTGELHFGDRASVRVMGYVHVVRPNSFVIKLAELIPLSIIMSEQRYIIQKTRKVAE